MIARLIREPLLHFLLLGSLLFVVYSVVNSDNDAPGPEEIVIDEARLAMLVSRYERTWQRKPSEAELVAIVDAWVRDEVLYREGLELGLDRDDPVVRQRIAQKMDFISEGMVPAPDDDALASWLQERADRYKRPARFALEQVFIDPRRHGEGADAHAEELLAALQAAPASAEAVRGDPTMLPARLSLMGEDQILRTFGNEFSGQLGDLPVGEWSGPVMSSFGFHLVRILESEPSRLPALAEVREAVERDWLSAETDAAQEALYQAMRDQYTVRLEVVMPESAERPEP